MSTILRERRWTSPPGVSAASHTGRAFTLIELLVVVAIIALLVAVLLPSLKKARDNAKVVACRANLHDFGLSLQQYADASRGYYPLPCYVGTLIYQNDPSSDDNLLILWLTKHTRNVATYTCPATRHKVRVPEKIEKVAVADKGIRYDVYTAGELRNDFEFHGELIRETLKSGTKVPVHFNGTSYEYAGWDDGGNGVKTAITWYPFNATKSKYDGSPRTLSNVKHPATDWVMKDADEGGDSRGDVVGAPPGAAMNNLPEAWDNHGKKLANMLHFDAHVVSYPYAYWEAQARKKGLIGY